MLDIEIFEECKIINNLIENCKMPEARSKVISLLDKLHKEGNAYTPLVNHFIREVGLFPYIDKYTASWEDRVAVEAFKANIGEEELVTLHIAQSKVLKRLLNGENIAISAPTSFGKSFIIDAFIAIRKPENVVILVPTIALADETRRRIEHKFSASYKIITTSDASISERNIFIFPQERCFAYLGRLKTIDILIVDEFYKVSSIFDDRSSTLLSAIVELGKIARQKYYLAPNIHNIDNNVFTQDMQFMKLVDFKTVITKAAKVYTKLKEGEDLDTFKNRHLINILNQSKSKTLIYAGSYSNIHKISKVLLCNLVEKKSSLLRDFSEWLEINYGKDFSLCKLSRLGIGVHNGKMHRSLSQLQIKMFEKEEGIDTMISTSSIIEGVNTQAEQVILWSNMNGSNKFDYFTYRNIIGRSGRMFKYFVGKVYLLEQPPSKETTTLSIDFPEEVVESLDPKNPGVEINQKQNDTINDFENSMISFMGKEEFDKIRKMPAFKSCSISLVKKIVKKLNDNPDWPKEYVGLSKKKSYYWREPLLDVIELLGNSNMVGLVKLAIWKLPFNWNCSLLDIYLSLKEKGYNISYEDIFSAERYISYNLSSTLSVISIIKNAKDPKSPNISSFIGRAANAFLPKLVYQLEEYGLPRMLSRKIQNTGLINLENDNIEISDIIKEFNKIGKDRLISNLRDILPFDVFILDYFYEGIS